MLSPSEDENEDWDSDVAGWDCISEGGSSCSSWSESETPEASFDAMPARLTLPLELQRLVLSYDISEYHEMWGTHRLVCKAWKEQVEFLARTEWIRETTFDYPGDTIWDPEHGKVYLNGDFTFQRLEGELAVFQIMGCAPEFREALVDVCQDWPVPDVEVGETVHDVEIDGMVIDWDTLTLTCGWRTVIGRVLAEELRVDAHRARSHAEMMTAAKRMRHKCGADVGVDNLVKMMRVFAANYLAAYVAVRRARLGRADKPGEKRLKMARHMASFRRCS
ncbi:hypothetical protein FB451DRAFT_1168164 [Mycena latifolia]|nr:hypothetical protein FB451DRAFT_1168164 [Mycena latifolia]